MTSSVFSRVAGLGALTAAGQLLIVGSLPAYSNIFDPSTYGEYVIFVGMYSVLSVLAGLRYDSAIVLPRNDGVAYALSALIMSIALTVSASIVALTVITAAFELTPVRWDANVGHFGYGLAVATAVGALLRCLAGWCVRRSRFLLIGWGQFVFCLVTVVAQLSLVHIVGQLPALIWGYVCALAFQTLCLMFLALHMRRPRWAFRESLRGMKIVARKYRRFPTYMVGYALASTVRDRLIQVVFGIGAGAAVVGRFGLAYRVMFAPNSLVYASVSPVFFAIASRGSRLSVGRFAAGLVEAIFVVLVVPYTAFAIEAPALTDAVLSPKWEGTGPYLQALAGPALLLATTCWLDRAFDSFRRQSVAFSLEASFTVISVVCVGFMSKLIDPVSVAWIFGAVSLAYYWIYFLSTFVACGFPLSDFRRACISGLMSSSGALVLGALTHQIPSLFLRFPVYALGMAAVIAIWARFRGGADILRSLTQSRTNDQAT
jgi:O-antigen/teichoic acid export membrane protein